MRYTDTKRTYVEEWLSTRNETGVDKIGARNSKRFPITRFVLTALDIALRC